ncbi:hypothetical protein [Dietzia lutea]|nr:hypothetical protein [Dietzia lutea]
MNHQMINMTLEGLKLIQGEAHHLGDTVSSRRESAMSNDDLEALTTTVLFAFQFLVVNAVEAEGFTLEEAIGTGRDPHSARWRAFMLSALGGGRDNGTGYLNTEVLELATSGAVALVNKIAAERARRANESTDRWPASRVIGEYRGWINSNRDRARLTHPEAVQQVTTEAFSDQGLRQRRVDVALRFREAISHIVAQAIEATKPEPTAGEVSAIHLLHSLDQTVHAALACIDSGWSYPASVLDRSIVETEMILHRFAAEQGSWDRWAKSERKDRDEEWSARAIYRDPSNHFRRVDYSSHSEHGGHPTPAGVQVVEPVLRADEERTRMVLDMQLSHQNVHLSRCVQLGWQVVEMIAGERGVTLDGGAVADALTVWEAFERGDPLISLSSHHATPDKAEGKRKNN